MKPINPITKQDYPDPDVIRVDDTYYMLSTTMHFFPGGAILTSKDLVNWEILNYLYDSELDGTDAEKMRNEQNIYGHGMWAPTLRFHKGTYYALFVSIGLGRTYLFTAKDPSETWEKHILKGNFYDASLLFDDDDKVYIVHGNRTIRITELDLQNLCPKKNGLDIEAYTDKHNVGLGYEGSHIQKINGYYYIFNIHWPKDDPAIRTETVHRSKKISGPYEEKEMIRDDYGLPGQGVAQGGIVDTPDGKWYGIFFRDQGACGRIPILTGITFEKGWPVVGKSCHIDDFEVPSFSKSNPKEMLYTSLFGERDSTGATLLKKQWQFNHAPDKNLFTVTEKSFTVWTDKVSANICEARNMLTQRVTWPGCSAEVTVDCTGLNDLDYAGLAIFSSCYGELAVTRELGDYYLLLITRDKEDLVSGKYDCIPGKQIEKIRLTSPIVRLRIDTDFENLKDTAVFSYRTGKNFEKIAYTHKLRFTLDHFCGARFGLFCYSGYKTGGTAVFKDFKYIV